MWTWLYSETFNPSRMNKVLLKEKYGNKTHENKAESYYKTHSHFEPPIKWKTKQHTDESWSSIQIIVEVYSSLIIFGHERENIVGKTYDGPQNCLDNHVFDIGSIRHLLIANWGVKIYFVLIFFWNVVYELCVIYMFINCIFVDSVEFCNLC